MSVQVEMAEVDGEDLWSMHSTYTEVSAGPELSKGERPVFSGSGAWQVIVPGRTHALTLSLEIDGQSAQDVSLDFFIQDYTADGYRFAVSGTVGAESMDTTVEGRNLCTGDG